MLQRFVNLHVLYHLILLGLAAGVMGGLARGLPEGTRPEHR
jgi:hypothetical protein